MRGLKLYAHDVPNTDKNVASFTDAWIETIPETGRAKTKEVASFTDAWIETTCEPPFRTASNVASFTDAWIETDLILTSWR